MISRIRVNNNKTRILWFVGLWSQERLSLKSGEIKAFERCEGNCLILVWALYGVGMFFPCPCRCLIYWLRSCISHMVIQKGKCHLFTALSNVISTVKYRKKLNESVQSADFHTNKNSFLSSFRKCDPQSPLNHRMWTLSFKWKEKKQHPTPSKSRNSDFKKGQA